MTRGTVRYVALSAALALGAIVAYQGVDAAVTKGKSRAAATKYLMRGIAQVNCAAAGKMLKETAPADDKEWDTLACHASLLNELGYLLMDDGRCPDKTWAEAAKTLQAESAKVLAAAEAKNFADAQASFKAMTGACGSCHKAHKK